MKKFKQQGFTMLELITVICIMTIVTSFSFPSFIKTREEQAYKVLQEDLSYFMNGLADFSATKHEILEIEFDLNSKLIFAKKDGMIFKRFKLPKNFEYEDINGDKLIKRNTTDTGNINSGFSLYVFNKNNEAVFRKTFINNRKYVQYLDMNKYEPKVEHVKKGEHKETKNWILVE